MHCMVSASSCPNRAVVNCENKLQMDLALREDPQSGCSVYWWKHAVSPRLCKDLNVQERDFSTHAEEKESLLV